MEAVGELAKNGATSGATLGGPKLEAGTTVRAADQVLTAVGQVPWGLWLGQSFPVTGLAIAHLYTQPLRAGLCTLQIQGHTCMTAL